MKLVRSSEDALILNLTQAERRLFTEVLELYPVVPSAYQPLSRSLKDKAAGEEQDLLNSYQLGVNAYVVKPVKFQSFVEAVEQVGAFWAVINEPPPESEDQPEFIEQDSSDDVT